MAKKIKRVKKAMSKKKKAKKVSKKKAVRKTKAPKPVGVVTHFYNEISVAIIKFNKKIAIGARLAFRGATTDFEEEVKSMQYNHEPITIAPKGKQIGIKFFAIDHFRLGLAHE